jgi:hypothetical protein
MARGNRTIVTADPKGQFEEGYVATGQTFYPGMVVQVDASVALKGGRHTYGVYNRDADGNMPAGPYYVVTGELHLLVGLDQTVAYAAGERVSLYSPRAGEELNLLLLNVAGTADDHALGEILMVDDGTGKLIVTTGTPESECALLKEAVTDPTADTLAWCVWTGH